MDDYKLVEQLQENFLSSKKLLIALGDETRFHIVYQMMKMNKCIGVRVGEITKSTNLSRPAVSHHLKILKEAGIIKYREEGTMNFYYFDPNIKDFNKLIETLELIIEISKKFPKNKGGI